MNYEKMAGEIKNAIRPWLRRTVWRLAIEPSQATKFDETLAAKLQKLFPVPEDLEAAVVKAEAAFHSYSVGSFEQCVMKYVAPLLAERDERINKLERKLEDRDVPF